MEQRKESLLTRNGGKMKLVLMIYERWSYPSPGLVKGITGVEQCFDDVLKY